jgi:hypothetical protein
MPHTFPPDHLQRLTVIFGLLVLFAMVCPTSASAQYEEETDERLWGRGGFTPVLGGLAQTAGTTIGLRYDHFLRHPNLTLAADARVSHRLYVGLQAIGGYSDEQFSAYGVGRYHYRPRELFYGYGPNTSRDVRGDFRIDEYSVGALGGVRISPSLGAGVHASYVDSRFGDGLMSNVEAIEEVFDPLPANATDSRYVPIGLWVEYDTRLMPIRRRLGARTPGVGPSIDGHAMGTSRGVYLAAEIRPYLPLDDHLPAFTNWTIESTYFHPLRYGMDGLAMRILLDGIISPRESDVVPLDNDQQAARSSVPFYLLPALGGSHTVRGFAPARFRDHNMWVANLEYRRSVFMFVDAAVFVDAGQVFYETEDLALGSTEFGYGVGFIARVGRFALGRMDIARSREGFQLYLRAGATF